jgi:carboxyl-terminal processing protease
MSTYLNAGVRKYLGVTLLLGLLLTLGAVKPAVSANKPSPTGIALYHQIWETAAHEYHDVHNLTNWSQWEHKFDTQIFSEADAVVYANQMLASLKDQYTFAMNQERTAQFFRDDDGLLLGVGIRWAFKLDERPNAISTANNTGPYLPYALQVFANSPAARAGIKAGDVVTFVNGIATDQLSTQQFLNGEAERKVGEKVLFTFLHEGKPVPVSLDVAYVKAPATYTSWLPGKFGLITLYNFDQSSVQRDMADALNRFKTANGLVLDLRGNGGGYTETALKVLSMLIKEGTLVTFANRLPGDPNAPRFEDVRIELTPDKLVRVSIVEPDGKPKPANESRQVYLLNGKPLVVLVDRNTASASEICTGAIQDNEFDENGHRDFWVLGTSNTYGKGIGQTVNNSMLANTVLKVTSFEWRTPKGRWPGDANDYRPGLIPDMVVPSKLVFQLYSYEDIPFQTAIRVLKGAQPLTGVANR